MSTTTTHRLIGFAFAALAATSFAACGDLEAPAQNIGQPGPDRPDPAHDRDSSNSPTYTENDGGQATYSDPRRCTPDPDIARKEHRTLCGR